MTEKKFKRMLMFGNMCLAVLFLSVVSFLRIYFNVAMVLVLVGVFPFYIMGLTLMVKILDRLGCKPYLDAMEKEDDEEEEREARKGRKPSAWGLTLMSLIGLVVAGQEGVKLALQMKDEWEGMASVSAFMPQIITSLTLATCALLLLGLVCNVWRRRVFTSVNSWLINGVAATLILSVLVQKHYWDTTPMLPNGTVFALIMLLAICISFCGTLFEIAVEMKKEQDLTV